MLLHIFICYEASIMIIIHNIRKQIYHLVTIFIILDKFFLRHHNYVLILFKLDSSKSYNIPALKTSQNR